MGLKLMVFLIVGLSVNRVELGRPLRWKNVSSTQRFCGNHEPQHVLIHRSGITRGRGGGIVVRQCLKSIIESNVWAISPEELH
jgi:hypothetical protein